MSFLLGLAKDYLYPPTEFNMLKCFVDVINGNCYANFQKMTDVNRQAVIKKTISAAVAAGVLSSLFLGPGSVIQVSFITSALTFAMETCPYGQLNIDFRRLRT